MSRESTLYILVGVSGNAYPFFEVPYRPKDLKRSSMVKNTDCMTNERASAEVEK